MNFYLIGIDYKTAPLELRGSLHRKYAAINGIFKRYFSGKAIILSTCNRFEIYGINSSEPHILKDIDFIRSLVPELRGAYIKFGINAVFRHLARLAAGLESQFRGELQILQQLEKWAYQESFPRAFKALLEEALSLAKMVRRESGLLSGEHNIAAAVFYDLEKQVPFSSRPGIIIAGTGKIAELFARYKPEGPDLYFAAHKNIGRARELSGIAAANAVEFKEIAGLLGTADVLVSATLSPHFIFFKKDFINLRRRQPLYIYDLAMPADIEPAVSNIEGIILKDLQALTGVFEEYNARLSGSLKSADYLIEEACKEK